MIKDDFTPVGRRFYNNFYRFRPEQAEATLLVRGTTLLMDDGTELLVGDISSAGGMCNCCPINLERVVAFRRGE